MYEMGKGGYYQESTTLHVPSIQKDNRDNGVMREIHSLFYLLYPLTVLLTGELSSDELPLNDHVCILKIGFCLMSENFFLHYLHYPLAVL